MKSQRALDLTLKEAKGMRGIDVSKVHLIVVMAEQDAETRSREYTMREDRDRAIKAVELAEADARERAVRAHRLSCPAFDDGRGICFGDINHKPCDMKCGHFDDFLKHYDNENQ